MDRQLILLYFRYSDVALLFDAASIILRTVPTGDTEPSAADCLPSPPPSVKLTGCMAEPELLLDSNIRLWVVLPIVFITFLVGVIRHYVSILLQSDKKLTLEQVSDRSVFSQCNNTCVCI